jgi:hypothetical protein
MNVLKHQIENDLYKIYPKIYVPAYKTKKILNILCGADYNTRVCTFEKIGENQIVVEMDNSFIGFCRDIFLNPSFDYLSSFKFNESCFYEIAFDDIWKTIQEYNNCRNMNKQKVQDTEITNFIELPNLKCINSTTNVSFKHYPIPSFINKNNFIQGIKFGNSDCYTFIIEQKDFFCIIQCKGS